MQKQQFQLKNTVQNKLKRHQASKQKGLSYQRTLSCKSLNKTQSLPTIGQYVIKKKDGHGNGNCLPTIPQNNNQNIINNNINQNQHQHHHSNSHLNSYLKLDQKKLNSTTNDNFKITKNIKLILKEKYFQPASQVINDVVNKKIYDQNKNKKNSQISSSSNKDIDNSKLNQNMNSNTALYLNLNNPSQSNNKFQHIQTINYNISKDKFRPISAQIYQELQRQKNIDESIMLKQAFQFDKKYYQKQQQQKKNTFMVKPKNPYPKYVQGYNLIKLDDNDRYLKSKTQEIQSSYSLCSYNTIKNGNQHDFSLIPEEEDDTQNKFTNFLPTEYYIIDDQTPQELLAKYGNQQQENIIGQSKWFQNGNYIWKKCRIIGFNKKSQRWDIQWFHTGKKKKVSRNNLRFQKQDKIKYNQKILCAEKYRQQSQAFLKYNWMIDLMQNQTHQINQQKQAKILQLATNGKVKKALPKQGIHSNIIKTNPIYKYVNNTLFELINQIKTLYIRSNHQAQFNATLPYNQQRKKYFIKFLPKCLFQPNKQTQIMIHSKINITKQNKIKLQNLFVNNLTKIKQKSSLANPQRLKVLESLNKIQQQLQLCTFFKLDYKHKMLKSVNNGNQLSFEQAKDFIQNNIRQVFYMITCKICDLQYLVGVQLDPIYLEKKSIGQQSFNKVIGNYRKFLYLVDFRLQNKIQEVFINTFNKILQPFEEWINKNQILSDNVDNMQIQQKSKEDINKINIQNDDDQQQKLKEDEAEEKLLQVKAQKQFKQTKDQALKLKNFRNKVDKFNAQAIYQGLKVKINLQIKDGKLQSVPQISKIKQFFFEAYEKITDRVKDLNCVTKSYIEPIRPKNKLQVLQKTLNSNCANLSTNSPQSSNLSYIEQPLQEKDSIKSIKTKYYKKMNEAFLPIEKYISQIQNMVNQITSISNDIKKRMQKKNNYNQIQQSIQIINDINRKVDILLGKQKMNYLILSINCQEVIIKLKSKITQTMKQIYKLLHQRITKDNQKLEKQIDSIVQILDKQPKNIDQMIQLESYAQNVVPQQFQKINSRANATAQKVSLLQKTNCKVQYKDFEACFKIYVKPLKVTKRKAQCLRMIQYSYKRTFGQQLAKQTLNLLEEIKECQQKVRQLTQVKDLKQMQASFMSYSRLNQKIQNAMAKMEIILRRQLKMSWKQTNFDALQELKEQFQPFYKLISLAKNFHYQVQSQLQQPFYTVDANILKKDIQEACKTLQYLEKDIFGNNQKILAIVQQVKNQYIEFKKYIPMMVALRNQDLKQRHWNRIKKITGHHDIQSQDMSMAELLNRNIYNFTNQIMAISQIASKQLTYQKQLNKLKKQWKEVKVKVCFYSQTSEISIHRNSTQKLFKKDQNVVLDDRKEKDQKLTNTLRKQSSIIQKSPINNSSNNNTSNNNNNNKISQVNTKQTIKILSNLNQIRKKAENDIFNVQNILSTDYVKFLEADIIAWRNSTLYKVYEVIDVWNKLQLKIILFFGLFSNKNTQQEIINQYNKFKIIDKTWKTNIQQIQNQPAITEMLQSKTAQNMRYIQQLIQDIQKEVSKYFQKKKQDNIRLNFLSNEQLMIAFAVASPFGNIGDLDSFILKCFSGIISLVRNEKNKDQSYVNSIQNTIHQILELKKEIPQITQLNNNINNNIIEQKIFIQPDKLIQNIQKQIKIKLKDSLINQQSPISSIINFCNNQSIDIVQNKQKKSLVQIKLLKMRIQFTYNVQQAFLSNNNNNDNNIIKKLQELLQDLFNQRQQLIYSMKQSKNLDHLTTSYLIPHILVQLSNQINTLEYLIQNQIYQYDSFQWLSQIKSYMRQDSLNDKLCQVIVSIGAYQNRYSFSLVNQKNSYIASYNTSKMFFSMAMALKQKMMISITGLGYSGKQAILCHLSQKLGRQINVINCHSLMNQQNIIESIRMGVSGLWTACKNINQMSDQMISFLSSTLQVIWSSLKQCTKKFSVNIHNTIIKGNSDEFGFFITSQIPKFSQINQKYQKKYKIPKSLKDYFRNIQLIKPDPLYIIRTMLITEQLISQNIQQKIIAISKNIDYNLKLMYEDYIKQSQDQYQNQDINQLQQETLNINKNLISLKQFQQIQSSNIKKQIKIQQTKQANKISSYLNFHQFKFFKNVCENLIKLNNVQDCSMMQQQIFQRSIVNSIKSSILSQQIRKNLLLNLKSCFKFKYVEQKSLTGNALKMTQMTFAGINFSNFQKGQNLYGSINNSNLKQSLLNKDILLQSQNKDSSSLNNSIMISQNKAQQQQSLNINNTENISIKKQQLSQQEIKNNILQNALLQGKLYVNLEIFSTFNNLLETVQNNRTTVVLSNQISGKSALINTLEHVNTNNFSIELIKINPMSLELHQLYGGVVPLQDKASYKIIKSHYKGIFNQILEKTIQNLNRNNHNKIQSNTSNIFFSQNNFYNSKLNSCKKLKGLVLDSNLSFKWYQPLISLLDSSNQTYNYPNGGSLSLQNNESLRFIFETPTLKDVSPTFLSTAKVIPISINLKWQNIFSTHLRTNFPNRFIKCKFLTFMELMVPFIMDPALEFYESSFKATRQSLLGNSSTSKRSSIGMEAAAHILSSSKTTKNIKLCSSNNLIIPSVQIVATCLRMFQSLIEEQFGPQIDGDKLIQMHASDVFNFFIFSLIWTVGALIPDQSKNTFSRHFKYLIKRAIQINIKGIERSTLPKDQQFIYDIYYEKGSWKTWQDLSLSNIKKQQSSLLNHHQNSTINTHIVSSDFTRVFYILKRYLQQAKSVFLVGKPSSSKNFIFTKFLSNLDSQKFINNMLSFSPNTSAGKLKETIIKTMLRDKYSENVKGFMNGKINIVYVCDLNLSSVKAQSKPQASQNYQRIIEFLRQFYNTQSLFLNDSSKPHKFKNLAFCGTLNSQLKLPSRIMRYMNPLLISSDEVKAQSILRHYIQQFISVPKTQQGILNSITNHVKNKTQIIIKCIKNFHEVIKRQSQLQSDIQFVSKDMIRICSAIIKTINISNNNNEGQLSQDLINKNLKYFIMRRWIYQSQNVYSQKMSDYKKQKLFYYLNNVLMQEERQRYKIIMPDPTLQITNLVTKNYFQEILLKDLKKKVISSIQSAIDSSIQQEVMENTCLQSKRINQSQLLPLQFLITDQMVLNLVKLSNGLSIESPIAFCINKHCRNIRAYAKILSFLKQRTLLIYQSKGLSQKQEKRQWLQFIKQNLLQRLQNQEDIAILIQINQNKKKSNQSNNPQYILDDLLNLKRIGSLSSLKIAQQQRFLQEMQCAPGYINSSVNAYKRKSNKAPQSKFASNKNKNDLSLDKNKKISQDSDQDSIQRHSSDEQNNNIQNLNILKSSHHKIWAIMHYKQKNNDLFKYYQSLLNQSTVIWMTDHAQQSYFQEKIQSTKEYIKIQINRIVKQYQQNNYYKNGSFISSNEIKQFLIEKIFSFIPTLEYLHKKLMLSKSLITDTNLILDHNKTAIFFSFLNIFVSIYSQIIINHHQVKKNNQSYIERIQNIEALTNKIIIELETLSNKEIDLFQEYGNIIKAIGSQQKDFNFYKDQHNQMKQTLSSKQKMYQQSKAKYDNQIANKKQKLQKQKIDLSGLVIKDKKIVMTIQIKTCFDMLALIFGKKKDSDDQTKQILKQFNNQKILKKINGFQPRQLTQKVYQRIKSQLQRLNKAPKKQIHNKDTILQETQNLSYTIKKYIESILQYYQKHRTLENLWMKIGQLTKLVDTLKNDFQKKSKNKNYLQVLQKYQTLSNSKINKQKQIQEVKKKLKNCKELKQLLSQFQEFKHQQKKTLKQDLEKSLLRQKNLFNFAITLSIKIRYQSIIIEQLTKENINKIKNLDNIVQVCSLKSLGQEKFALSQKQFKARTQLQLTEWQFLQDLQYKKLLQQIFDSFNNNNSSNLKMKASKQRNNNYRNLSLEMKQFYMKIFLQKGCILVQRNKYFDTWIKNIIKKENKQFESILNFLVDKTLKKSKSLSRMFDPYNRMSQQSNITSQMSKRDAGKKYSLFLELEDPNQIYKMLEKQSKNNKNEQKSQKTQQKIKCFQSNQFDEQTTIVIYSQNFDSRMKSLYPYINFKGLAFEEIIQQCQKLFESKKDSITEFDSKIIGNKAKIQKLIDEVHDLLIQIQGQMSMQRQIIYSNTNRNIKIDTQVSSDGKGDCQAISLNLGKDNSTKSIAIKNQKRQSKEIPQNFEMTETMVISFKDILNKLSEIKDIKNQIHSITQQKAQVKGTHNLQFGRLLKFLTKYFFGLKTLSEKSYIKVDFCLKKYLKIIKNIIDRQVKNNNLRGRLASSTHIQKIEVAIKKHLFGQIIWQDNTKSHGVILYIFMAVASMQNWQDLKVWNMIDYGLQLSLNLKLNQQLAAKVIKKKNWQKLSKNDKEIIQRCQQLLLTKNEQSNPFINQSQSFTNLFKQVINLIGQQVEAIKNINADIVKNQHKWVLFFLSISERTVKLPEPFENYGRVYMLFFILLFKPEILQKWMSNFSDNMGNITYSANLINNNAYLPLHVRLSSNLNSSFVWCPHWTFQNGLRKLFSIQKELFFQNILLVQQQNSKQLSTSRLSQKQKNSNNSLGYVMNLALLLKKNLHIINKGKTTQQNLSLITDAMRLGNWIFFDINNNNHQIISQIKNIQKNYQESNDQISQEYLLWISIDKKSNKRIDVDNYQACIEIVQKYLDCCVYQISKECMIQSMSNISSNDFTDYNPFSFYQCQSTSKRLRKQYDALSQTQKIQIFKILQNFDNLTKEPFKKNIEISSNHIQKNSQISIFSKYCSILQMILSFDQQNKRSSILNSNGINNNMLNQIKKTSNQFINEDKIQQKKALVNQITSNRISRNIKTRQKPINKKTNAQKISEKLFYTNKIDLKFELFVKCLKYYYFNSELKNNNQKILHNSNNESTLKNNQKVQNNSHNKLDLIKRQAMDDLTRNLAQQIDFNFMLNLSRDNFILQNIKKSINNHRSIHKQLNNSIISFIQFLHFCYYGTLHLHEKISNIKNIEEQSKINHDNIVQLYFLKEYQNNRIKVLAAKQLIQIVKGQYENITLSHDINKLFSILPCIIKIVQIKVLKICKKFGFKNTTINILANISEIIQQSLKKDEQFKTNLLYFKNKNQIADKLQLNLKNYQSISELLYCFKVQYAKQSKLSFQEIDTLVYLINIKDLKERCRLQQEKINQNKQFQIQFEEEKIKNRVSLNLSKDIKITDQEILKNSFKGNQQDYLNKVSPEKQEKSEFCKTEKHLKNTQSLLQQPKQKLKKCSKINKNKSQQKNNQAQRHMIILKGSKIIGGEIINGLLNVKAPVTNVVNRNSYKQTESHPFVSQFDNNIGDSQYYITLQFVEKEGEFNKTEHQDRIKLMNQRYRNFSYIDIPIIYKQKHNKIKELLLKCPVFKKQKQRELSSQKVSIQI